MGSWRIEGTLGKGGMASVYAVVHTRFGKRAALKVAHSAILGPQFTADTFLREARVVHLIDHPSMPDVFAIGTYDNRPYLVMERLAGHTLGARLDKGALGRAEALSILLDVCDVLRASHAAGVVHRDLKLDNIFVLDTPLANGRNVKLLDWGVSLIMGEPDPLQGVIAGTLTYVAPEEVRGDSVGPAADIYSLGVLAHHLLVGAPPFSSRNELELIRMQLYEQPPEPTARWPEMPTALAALLLRMLAKKPADRPALTEVIAVFSTVRKDLDAAEAARQSWRGIPRFPPFDVLGRPALRLSSKGQRFVGATIAVAAAVVAALAAASV
ncbi:MAG: serine/threonine-protein kinase [Kofleriaceae bacterium]|nr:serine/threonine-protein kinase [Kofleriaceae bacterium]